MSAAGKRRSSGCWTCRVRRKKCDETPITCRACSSRGIKCYGYGAQPIWMDGGLGERKMAEKFKQQLKIISRRSSKLMTVNEAQINPEISTISSVLPPLNDPLFPGLQSFPQQNPDIAFTSPPPSWKPCSHSTAVASGDYTQTDTITRMPESFHGIGLSFNSLISKEQTPNLIMHYLTYVFPRYFENYCLKHPQHSRGWLLALLGQSKSFFHTSAALSTYSLPKLSSSDYIEGSYDELKILAQEHCAAAMKEFLLLLASFESSEGDLRSMKRLEILANAWQFICLEIVQGKQDTWMTYLETVTAFVYPEGYGNTGDGVLASYDSQRSEVIASEVRVRQALKQPVDPGLNLFTAVMLWADVLSCTHSTRTPDYAKRYRYLTDGPNPQINFKDTMGCENWVVMAILEIVLLDRWRQLMEGSNTLSIRELAESVAHIERTLEEGIANLSQPTDGSRSSIVDTDEPEGIKDEAMKSYIFACSALVYLHSVAAGSNLGNLELRKYVANAIESFDILDDVDEMQFLLWPLCICGSLSTEEQETRIRNHVDRVDSEIVEQASFKMTMTVLEDSWKYRYTSDGNLYFCHWMVSMERLGINPLLI